MPKSRTVMRPSGPQKTPVHAARDAADALFRAALECCHQHDRTSRVHAKSALPEEVQAAQDACQHCDDVLRALAATYEETAAHIRPTGEDEGWWHRANALWLASREYLRRNGGCNAATKELKQHDAERLGALQMEYELEASALLALRHAAEAYQHDRPSAT